MKPTTQVLCMVTVVGDPEEDQLLPAMGVQLITVVGSLLPPE